MSDQTGTTTNLFLIQLINYTKIIQNNKQSVDKKYYNKYFKIIANYTSGNLKPNVAPFSSLLL